MKTNTVPINEKKKEPTAAVAREILRRQNGYEANPDIDLSEYGYDENSNAKDVLRTAAGLNVSTPATSVPTKQEEYRADVDFAYDKIMNGGNQYYDNADSLEKPEYTSKYDAQIDSIIDKILNGEKFDYDVNEDALFANYADIYERNAKLAAENTMGNAAAASGGYGNSYAAALAGQAYNAQMQGLNEKVPELQQLAYEQYMAQKDEEYNKLNMLNTMEQQDYAEFRDDVADYNTERDYQLGMGDRYEDSKYNQFSAAQGLESEQYNRDYQAERDAEADRQWQESFDYNKEQDAYNRQFNEANAAAEIGNFDLLGKMLGIDTAEAEQWYKTQQGMELYSATGLVNYLKDAGIDVSYIEDKMKDEGYANNLSYALTVYEATGSPKMLNDLGIDTSYMDKILQYTLQDAEKSANSSSYNGSDDSDSEDNTPKLSVSQEQIDKGVALLSESETDFENYIETLEYAGYSEDDIQKVVDAAYNSYFTDEDLLKFKNALGTTFGLASAASNTNNVVSKR